MESGGHSTASLEVEEVSPPPTELVSVGEGIGVKEDGSRDMDGAAVSSPRPEESGAGEASLNAEEDAVAVAAAPVSSPSSSSHLLPLFNGGSSSSFSSSFASLVELIGDSFRSFGALAPFLFPEDRVARLFAGAAMSAG